MFGKPAEHGALGERGERVPFLHDRLPDVFRHTVSPVDPPRFIHRDPGLRGIEGRIGIESSVDGQQRARGGQRQDSGFFGEGQTVRQDFAHAVSAEDIRFESSHADHRNRGLDPFVHRRQPHSLVAAARGAARPDPVLLHIRQGTEQIDAAHVVDQLESHQAFPELERRAAEQTAVADEFAVFRAAFAGAERIDRQTDITGFSQQMAPLLNAFGQSALFPVPVHIDDRGERSLAVRHIKISGHPHSRTAQVTEVMDLVTFHPDGFGDFHFQRNGMIEGGAQGFPDSGTEFTGFPFFQSERQLVHAAHPCRFTPQFRFSQRSVESPVEYIRQFDHFLPPMLCPSEKLVFRTLIRFFSEMPFSKWSMTMSIACSAILRGSVKILARNGSS